MRPRKGTKATQGTNAEASSLERWTASVGGRLASLSSAALAPCPYPRHRPSDWVTPIGPLVCGICHPPAAEFDGIRRRGEEGFDELVAQAAARVVRSASLPDGEPVEEEAIDLEDLAVRLPKAARNLADALDGAAAELDLGLDAALQADA